MSATADTWQNAGSSAYLEAMYLQWRQDPSAVHKSWDVYFRTGSYTPPPTLVADYQARAGTQQAAAAGGSHSSTELTDVAKVVQLVRAFQVRGHLLASIDPLGLMKPRIDHADLRLESYGFSEKDLNRVVDLSSLDSKVTGFLSADRGKVTIGHIFNRLKEVYCSNIGYEYMHIPFTDQCNWIRTQIETRERRVNDKAKKMHILERLTWADHFERFCAKKWNNAKRFGVEGGEACIAGMKSIMDVSADHGVNSIVIGMPHRGRLNVLSTVIRKPLEQIFCEFTGGGGPADLVQGTGDVKYHLGMSLDRPFGKKQQQMHLSLVANPSHLEAVDPVVLGKTRAKQFYKGDEDRSQVMAILMHGDAAFAGQGVVYETMGMAGLKNYSTGGTIHMVVNNQVGFTTDPADGRSGPYCTDIAKAFNAPIFHVNGDDPEAVVHVCELAAEWRAKFKRDVVVDVVCYRSMGHNEIDEPRFTQPIMYNEVDKHKTVLKLYTQRLIDDKVATPEEIQAVSDKVTAFLEEKFEAAKTYKHRAEDWLASYWKGFKGEGTLSRAQPTGVDKDTLTRIGTVVSTVPEGFKLHPRIATTFAKKLESIKTGKGIDWGTGEALAFGSLLEEGIHVRLSGQDVERGTFTHRHAVLHDQAATERTTYTPLNHLSAKQAKFTVSNSHLSEFGVMGFELGYSSENPKALVLWEAQFGDFFNGAQIIVDQFLSSGEAKWLRQTGLVLLLPHGMEGQGPEHSSARLERFLQMSDDDPTKIPPYEDTPESKQIQSTNWQVVNITTPANYFHALRRQVYREFRKPLVVMSPKQLLRFAPASSTIDEFGPQHRFQKVIGETDAEVVKNAAKVRRVVYCSGKVYYDIVAKRSELKINDVALIRVEQLSPFPFGRVAAEAAKYPKAELVWCQEEPRNMGAWTYVEPRFETALKGKRLRYVGRGPAASPAVGNKKVHDHEQADLVKAALA